MTETAEKYARMLAESFPGGGAWSAQSIQAVLARPGGQIFENAGGFVIVQAVLDEAEIWTLLVRPEFRRRGHARALMTMAITSLKAKGVKSLFLEVAQDNRAAIALYQSFDFVETARRKGYYRTASGAPVDALVMRRTL